MVNKSNATTRSHVGIMVLEIHFSLGISFFSLTPRPCLPDSISPPSCLSSAAAPIPPSPLVPPPSRLPDIIRGGAVLSPVSSIRPWISRASAGPCRPLSLTPDPSLSSWLCISASRLSLRPLSACAGLQAHAAAIPAHSPFPPLLLLRFKLPAPDSRPSPRL